MVLWAGWAGRVVLCEATNSALMFTLTFFSSLADQSRATSAAASQPSTIAGICASPTAFVTRASASPSSFGAGSATDTGPPASHA